MDQMPDGGTDAMQQSPEAQHQHSTDRQRAADTNNDLNNRSAAQKDGKGAEDNDKNKKHYPGDGCKPPGDSKKPEGAGNWQPETKFDKYFNIPGGEGEKQSMDDKVKTSLEDWISNMKDKINESAEENREAFERMKYSNLDDPGPIGDAARAQYKRTNP